MVNIKFVWGTTFEFFGLIFKCLFLEFGFKDYFQLFMFKVKVLGFMCVCVFKGLGFIGLFSFFW
jgi:Zn-dependent protease